MRRFVCLGLVLLLLTGWVDAQEAPVMSAAGAVLMDADSGRLLFEHDSRTRRPIASITKLMTALVALESGHDPGEVVTIREEWTGIEGSSLYLRPGEEITLEGLLYGLLLHSGNDAAQAVAGYCAGDVDAFVDQMNERARALGMADTHFANPSGLDHPEHYSTARDMAVLALACLGNERLAEIVSTPLMTVGGRVLTNHNKLLIRYEGCIGLKTGYTEKAGRTLVSAAKRDGMTLICVTLNAPDDWRDHAALFDLGFANYSRCALVKEGAQVCTIPVSGSLVPLRTLYARDGVWAALTQAERDRVTVQLSAEPACAPCGAGEAAGESVFLLDGQELGRSELVFGREISRDLAPERTGIARFFGR